MDANPYYKYLGSPEGIKPPVQGPSWDDLLNAILTEASCVKLSGPLRDLLCEVLRGEQKPTGRAAGGGAGYPGPCGFLLDLGVCPDQKRNLARSCEGV